MNETLIQRLDRIEREIESLKSKSPTKHTDYGEQLAILSNKVSALSLEFKSKKHINITAEIKKHVDINYINDLYRNR